MNFEVISDCQEKHLKTFVWELQIVQHLENPLVQHYISQKLIFDYFASFEWNYIQKSAYAFHANLLSDNTNLYTTSK
jgi:hypothetical protein